MAHGTPSNITYSTVNGAQNSMQDVLDKIDALLTDLNANFISDDEATIEVFKTFASNCRKDFEAVKTAIEGVSASAESLENTIIGNS